MAQKPGERWKVRTITFVVGVLCSVTVLSLAAALAVTLGAAAANTRILSQERVRLTFRVLAGGAQAFFRPAVEAVDELAPLVEEIGVADIAPEDLDALLRAALSGAANVRAIAYTDLRGWMISAFRDHDGELNAETVDWREMPGLAALIADGLARRSAEPYWSEPLYVEPSRSTQLIRLRPVFAPDGSPAGAIAATVRAADLSTALGALDPVVRDRAFLLTEDDRALAHRSLVEGSQLMSAARPLPSALELGDPVLASLAANDFEGRAPEGSVIDARLLADPNVGTIQTSALVDEELGAFVFGYAWVRIGGGPPWRLGAYLEAEETEQEFERLIVAGFIGLGVTIATALLAAWIGVRLSRPVSTLARAAGAARTLDFDAARLPPSRLREWDEAARAFNGMSSALAAFARYAPVPLVRRMLALDDRARAAAVRDVTVMFTDICGFTRLVENKDAPEIAELLNAHFGEICAAIAEEDGVVDKFIGDSVMAFWGAPEASSDHAERAVRAALAIADRCENGALRVRIGLHTGEVVAGEIGSTERLNYTIVGDAVNTAQRVEGFAAQLFETGEARGAVAIALTAETAARAPGFRFRSLGRHGLRGRSGSIEILTPEAEPAPR